MASIPQKVFQSWQVGLAVAVAFLVISFTVQGDRALLGASLGLFATTFSVIFLWLAVQMTGRLAGDNAKPYRGGVVVGLGFLIKLPLFVACGMFAQQVGGHAPTWFLLGLGVVYSALVGWAVTRP